MRFFRQRHGLTQKEFASFLKTAAKVVGHWESGERHVPTHKVQLMEQTWKDLDVAWLLTGKGRTPGGELFEKVADLERRLQNLEASQGALTRIEDQVERMRDAMGSPDKPRIQTDQ